MSWEQIQKDALAARKNRESEKATLLTTIIAQVKTMAIDDGHRAATDADLQKVIRQFLKGIQENLNLAAQGKLSAENKAKIEAEKAILESYLPKQLTADELKELIKKSGAANLGEAMKYLKENYDGQYDGKTAALVAKEVLGST